MRTWMGILLLVAMVFAGGKAEKLGAKAKAEMDAAKEGWEQYLRDSDQLTDDEIRTIAARYDKAIDLMQAITEEGESASANNGILLLGRRTAKLRAVLFHREMRRKAEAFEKDREARRKREDQSPEPSREKEKPEPKPGPETEAAKAKPGTPDVPEIFETKKERSAALRAIRRFAFEYFRHMKPGNIRKSCHKCNGKGTVMKPGSNGKLTQFPCGTCSHNGYYFDDDHARRAYWLTRTPLARSDEQVRAEYDARVQAGRSAPQDVKPITRLVIKRIDYHGLWAEVEWEESFSRKDKTTVVTSLIRLGRQWYFYTRGPDDRLLSETAAEANEK